LKGVIHGLKPATPATARNSALPLAGRRAEEYPRALVLKEPVQRLLAAVKGEILDTGRFDPATEIRPCGREAGEVR
jgi:hypothetical protein